MIVFSEEMKDTIKEITIGFGMFLIASFFFLKIVDGCFETLLKGGFGIALIIPIAYKYYDEKQMDKWFKMLKNIRSKSVY